MTYPLKLKAYANPAAGGHHALDHKGRPANYVTAYGAPDRVLGGQHDHRAMAKEGRVVIAFHGEAFDLTVNDSQEFAHYRESFLDGVLVAADKESAEALNLPFIADPVAHIKASHDAAYALFKREFKKMPHGAHTMTPEPVVAGEVAATLSNAELKANADAANALQAAADAKAAAVNAAATAAIAAAKQDPKPAPAAPSKDGSK